MKKKLIVFFLILPTLSSFSQGIDVETIINLLSLSEQKLINQLQKKGFKYSGTNTKSDTIIKTFNLSKSLNKSQNLPDTIDRNILLVAGKDECTLTYQTTSAIEASNLKKQLKTLGYYCNYEGDTSISASSLFYQHLNFTASIFETATNESILYAIKFHKKEFLNPEMMYYADDLLHFTSHEYLVYFFGEENVKKDIYFFTGNEISKCSVLFAGTSRQVVFIWDDEVNKRTISNLLFGGQQKLKSLINKNKYITESSWLLKSGLYAGMSLYELRKLNGSDFNFYAGNAINSGLVLDGSKGNINFKKENIILGCINCSDNKYRTTSLMSADKAMEDDRIMFVLSVVLTPAGPNNDINPVVQH